MPRTTLRQVDTCQLSGETWRGEGEERAGGSWHGVEVKYWCMCTSMDGVYTEKYARTQAAKMRDCENAGLNDASFDDELQIDTRLHTHTLTHALAICLSDTCLNSQYI